LNKLFENYNPLERPSSDESESVNVKLGLSLQQIIDVVFILVVIFNIICDFNMYVINHKNIG